jgi:hypothetical protein
MRRFGIGLCVTLCILLALNAPAMAAGKPADKASLLALNAVQALVDSQMQGIQGTLATLATSSEVQALDWDAMQPLLASFQGHCPPSAIWFAKPDGAYYTASGGLMQQTLADRAYFPALMGGQDVLGAVVISKSTGQLSAVVAVPIIHNATVAGALGASVFVDNAAEDLAAKLELPEGMDVLVLDATGETVVFPVTDAMPKWFAASKKAGIFQAPGAVELVVEGKPVTVLHRVSAYNGWHYLLAVQR